ncbi:hypothetical protein SUDANB70_00561 [Streptomyces sp. enrichment culture]
MAAPTPHDTDDWWRDAVIYQVYPRSFADSDGNGTGDLAGVRARLPYLADLGVDAVWFTPWYLSPLVDGGYDVADYRTVDPAFGTLAEAEKLIAEARALGIRTIVGIVPNHVSDQHPWFRAALAAGPGSPERELFHFRPGRGPDGARPPNDWPSQFSGATWTRVPDGEWYLHLFSPEQPDLNWAHPAVRREHEDILRFWFERGVAGVRIDSAALLTKDPALPDFVEGADPHPYIDRDDLHDVYRSWRAVADEYGGVFVGEVWLPDAERFARYLRPDELHTAFNFTFLTCPWEAGRLRRAIDGTLAEHAPVGAPATWVLCNHDVTRTVTRYGPTPASTSPRSASAPRPTRSSAPGGPVRRPCSPWPCPGRSTSTRGRNWACPRRTYRSTGSRTPCTSVPGGPIRGATAAGCPCRGRRGRGGTASAPGTSRGCRSPPPGRRTRSTGRAPTRGRCSRSTVGPCGCAGPRTASGTVR